MAKHATLPRDMLKLFNFAAMNPIQGPMMTQQMMLPAVMLQQMEQQEREMHRMGQIMAVDAEKAAQREHDEKQSVSIGGATEREEVSTTSFNLVYYNPETDEVQIIKEHVSINLKEYTQLQKPDAEMQKLGSGVQKVGEPIKYAAQTAMALDQSVGQKSTYPLYMNVAVPLATRVVDPIKLEIALQKIEVESPKPFGGGAAVMVTSRIFDKVGHKLEKEGIHAEIVAVDTLREVEELRAETLHQLDEQIKAFEHVIEELEVTDVPMQDLIKELPPLSRERYAALLKQQQELAETLLVDMLIADLEFLIVVKTKLKKMGLRDLLGTLSKIGKISGIGTIIHKEGGGGDDDDEDKEEDKKSK